MSTRVTIGARCRASALLAIPIYGATGSPGLQFAWGKSRFAK
jgi:hypothetical protein